MTSGVERNERDTSKDNQREGQTEGLIKTDDGETDGEKDRQIIWTDFSRVRKCKIITM